MCHRAGDRCPATIGVAVNLASEAHCPAGDYGAHGDSLEAAVDSLLRHPTSGHVVEEGAAGGGVGDGPAFGGRGHRDAYNIYQAAKPRGEDGLWQRLGPRVTVVVHDILRGRPCLAANAELSGNPYVAGAGGRDSPATTQVARRQL